MLGYIDVVIVAILGGLLVNPRRYRTLTRAILATFVCSACAAAGYLLITRPLAGPFAAFLDWMTGAFG
ncbi:hypothetical protein B0E38_07758 [Streptomyces sp. 111WW2]|uniref:hypothetical protein n=1 Tax=Streptomyces sp. 111WW2 TaxID=1945515 RepID=UPI000D0C8E8E|nr:hypothetical protein [Streptomyces sp. 111WW2]PSK43953.1 hypothetical protein B0E38_07758 [Streptomyces sp. 111WW2]